MVAVDVKYIMAFKDSANDETFEQARKDIEGMGGKIDYEYRSALKAVSFTLPNEDVTILSEKEYSDFIEQDKSVHTFE
ncbi:hypothetical protein CU098_010785 [Rhizopus stolonifer]|uniref:Inhibitor I9 domain-containing protein n=1 Tax=Rhizopus stolonifer TaxID=4846 RepID=A0A367KTB3_RHIST|nr:hypothetical protein CU098_010785 [Rhizopus stolonifer]